MPKEAVKKIDEHDVELSSLGKVLYPQQGITKQDVLLYYEKIAPYFLPYVKDHLMVLHRFPHGIDSEGFYQKQIADYFPKWITLHEIDLKKGGKQSLVVINSTATLLYLVNQYALVFHSWLSSIQHIDKPDKIVFDLDPSVKDLKTLRFAAKKIKAMLEAHGLTPFVMTSGSKGYHVVAPIIPQYSFDEVREFTKKVAQDLVKKYPTKFTIELYKDKREGRVFIDYLRNAYGQTSVAPYSLRAKAGAPVATPIDWDELSKVAPQKYTIKNIFKRLARKKDPWINVSTSARKLVLKI